jgi:hypothetical protein
LGNVHAGEEEEEDRGERERRLTWRSLNDVFVPPSQQQRPDG